jgi:hypothetical protein
MTDQALAPPEHKITTTGLLMLLQILRSSISIRAADCAVGDELVQRLIAFRPSNDPDIVIAVGATDIRSEFDEAVLSCTFDADTNFSLCWLLHCLAALLLLERPRRELTSKGRSSMVLFDCAIGS